MFKKIHRVAHFRIHWLPIWDKLTIGHPIGIAKWSQLGPLDHLSIVFVIGEPKLRFQKRVRWSANSEKDLKSDFYTRCKNALIFRWMGGQLGWWGSKLSSNVHQNHVVCWIKTCGLTCELMLFPTWYRFENLRLRWVEGTILEEILQIFGL